MDVEIRFVESGFPRGVHGRIWRDMDWLLIVGTEFVICGRSHCGWCWAFLRHLDVVAVLSRANEGMKGMGRGLSMSWKGWVADHSCAIWRSEERETIVKECGEEGELITKVKVKDVERSQPSEKSEPGVSSLAVSAVSFCGPVFRERLNVSRHVQLWLMISPIPGLLRPDIVHWRFGAGYLAQWGSLCQGHWGSPGVAEGGWAC